jgi:hypothetical protein
MQQGLCINKGKKILIVDQILTPLLKKYILLNYCVGFNTML